MSFFYKAFCLIFIESKAMFICYFIYFSGIQKTWRHQNSICILKQIFFFFFFFFLLSAIILLILAISDVLKFFRQKKKNRISSIFFSWTFFHNFVFFCYFQISYQKLKKKSSLQKSLWHLFFFWPLEFCCHFVHNHDVITVILTIGNKRTI